MFKLAAFFALIAFAVAAPAPKADPKAKPGFVAAAYTAPVVAAAPVAYTGAYSAPAYYSSAYSYSVYPYAAYAAYSAPAVIV